ncbi:hypothetical protein ABK040_003946 [Willaertia magna]
MKNNLSELIKERSSDIDYRIKSVIRYSLKRTAEEGEKYANEMKKEPSIRMPKSETHKSFTFKDFRPLDFGNLRKYYGINDREYFTSIGHSKLKFEEYFTKNNLIFAFTEDGKYIIKSITKNQSKLIRNIYLSNLLNFLKNEENSLIVPILGLHKFSINGNDIRFIVMKNILGNSYNFNKELNNKNGNFEILDIFNLKYNLNNLDENSIKKDINFVMKNNLKFNIGTDLAIEFLLQLKKDVNFLTSCDVFDYSLCIGHVKTQNEDEQLKLLTMIKNNDKFKYQLLQNQLNQNEFYFIGLIDCFKKFNKLSISTSSNSNNNGIIMDYNSSGAYADKFMEIISKIFQ